VVRTTLLALAATLAATLTAGNALAASFKAVLMVRDDDPRLERSRTERPALGQPGGPLEPAVALAIKDARLELDAAGAALTLETVAVTSAAAARDAAAKAEKAGAAALLADLPADWLLAAADGAKLPLLNLSAADDRLREKDCRPNLLHLIPSERMRADALAQTLAQRRWAQVLLLTGPGPGDAERSATAQAAIKRYGLKLAGSKPFKLSADPRERDLANPLLLTQGQYDVVWVVDGDGEFARALPYRTVLPRPVVGDAGLVALAWSPPFERFGAPQVSRRFAKTTGRAMQGQDWAAWLAGKALAGAAVAQADRAAAKAPGGPAAAFQKALAEGEIDGSKGVAMSFRPWDGQLRQPLWLGDGQSVVATAPVDGILHPKNALDTLGADAPEKLCKGRP
jgi:ABC transporter substrate binding protein (PQQ-dependent alcohol dehydrogenase system)